MRTLLLLSLATALAGPARMTHAERSSQVCSLEVPSGRIHLVLTRAGVVDATRDIVVVTDRGDGDGLGRKQCYVFPLREDAVTYAATPAYGRALPMEAVLVATGDLDRDGHADVVYVTRGGVFVLRGGAQGVGAEAQRVLAREIHLPPAADRTAGGQFLLDLTGDGRLDLLLPTPDGLALHAQQSDTTFSVTPTATLQFPVISQMFHGTNHVWMTYRAPHVRPADLNGDGRLDVSVLNLTDSYRFLQLEDGRFHRERVAGVLATDAGNSFTRGVYGDWNADGHPDAAFMRIEQRRVMDSELRIHMAASDGSLQSDPSTQFSAPSTLQFPMFLDATGNGQSELLLYRVHFGLRFALNYFLRNRITVDLALHRLTPDGVYDPAPALRTSISVEAFDSGAEPVRAAADVNADGASDVVVGLDPARLGVFLGDPERLLHTEPAWTVAVEAYGIAVVEDLDGNGRDDVLIRYPEPERQNRISVVLF